MSRRDHGRVLGKLFGSMILSILGIGATWFGVWSHNKVTAAESWPTAPGVVETSVIATSRGSKGRTSYRCKVTYRFQVNGATVTGNSLYPDGGSSSSSRSTAEEQLRRYPKGGPCTVHYDPADPSENCLEMGSTVLGWIFTLIGFAMFLGGAVGLAKFFLPMGQVR
jgi:hypothetical protein